MNREKTRLTVRIAALALVASALSCTADESTVREPNAVTLTGPYLGQAPPDSQPVIFAPGVVSTGMYERDIAITPDGKEIYFGVTTTSFNFAVIVMVREVDGVWTEPEVAPFSGLPGVKDLEPCISPDGERFFFLSTRSAVSGGEPGSEDIWVMDRQDGGWGEPTNLGSPINTDQGEYFPSVTQDGTLYFTREDAEGGTSAIYRSRFIDGRYEAPERLPESVNTTQAQFNAFIAPDESYLILCVFGREDTFGRTDYYVCFRSADDVWSEPVNLGETINTASGLEYSPYVSRDGRFFFFMSSRTRSGEASPGHRLSYGDLKQRHGEPENGNPDIYWVRASFIEQLRSD